MIRAVTRRDFLKLSGLSLAALAAAPLPTLPRWQEFEPPQARGRVTIRSIYVYKQPDFKSERIGTRKRDRIVYFREEILSPAGPAYNPLWYRLSDGFVHSAYLQRLDDCHVNSPLPWIPENGILGEVTIPFTQALRPTVKFGWVPLYRLYHRSVFWITDIVEGPDGAPWYALTDDLLHIKYCVPAAHMRAVQAEELTPISPYLSPGEKRIEVSLADQSLTAYEGKRIVLHTKISTGIPSSGPTPNGIPTSTPSGSFHVEVKVPSRHMGDGNLTADLEAYELPGVPWVSFFHETGVGFHGTYWHNNFGRMMSHGCVNMRNEDAKWLYRWTNPIASAEDWQRLGHGTYVRVQ